MYLLYVQAIKTEATGLYSRKAFERLGFEAVSEILYSEYEVDEEKIFENIKNHRGTAFMIKNNSEVIVCNVMPSMSFLKCNEVFKTYFQEKRQ